MSDVYEKTRRFFDDMSMHDTTEFPRELLADMHDFILDYSTYGESDKVTSAIAVADFLGAPRNNRVFIMHILADLGFKSDTTSYKKTISQISMSIFKDVAEAAERLRKINEE
jgi:hypothetical protein